MGANRSLFASPEIFDEHRVPEWTDNGWLTCWGRRPVEAFRASHVRNYSHCMAEDGHNFAGAEWISHRESEKMQEQFSHLFVLIPLAERSNCKKMARSECTAAQKHKYRQSMVFK